jgi:hypothetical protein
VTATFLTGWMNTDGQWKTTTINVKFLETFRVLPSEQTVHCHCYSCPTVPSPQLPHTPSPLRHRTVNITDMRRLTTGIRSEKCVVRRFLRCANVIECNYTKLDSIAYYTPRQYGIAYCS